MLVLTLTWKSIKNRKVGAGLTVFSIAISVFLLLGIERIRIASKLSFENTIHGVDLIVGARSGPLQLLLYSVFRIGNPTNNVRYSTYQALAEHPEVAWSFPVSLGDSHRGYRVIGTSSEYFQHYKFGGAGQSLKFSQGRLFKELFDVVIGSEVASKLSYKLGDRLTLEHGISKVAFQKHENLPFIVKGILEKTGTPVDRSLHVSLEAIEAIHIGWEDGAAPLKEEQVSAAKIANMSLKPAQITSFFLASKSRIGIFNLQREINESDLEPLLAVLPGVVFRDLWSTVGIVEQALFLISLLVLFSGLIGMTTTIYATLDERRREMAILRSCGARPFFVFGLFLSEATFLAGLGGIVGILGLRLGLIALAPLFSDVFGLDLIF